MATTHILNLTLTLSPPALVALRIAPLLGTSCSLVHAYCELITTSAFLTPPPINNALSVFLAGHKPSSSSTRTSTSTSPSSSEKTVASTDAETKAKAIILPIWMLNFFNRGVFSVVALNSVSLYSSLANLFLFPNGLGEYKTVFATGLVFTVAHLAFVPAVAPSVKALYRMCVRQQTGGQVKFQETDIEKEKEKGRSAEAWLREWNSVHRIRMFSVDLVAWGCFAWAVVGVLSQGL